MKYVTRPVHFYNNSATKVVAVALLMIAGFFFGVKAKPQQNFAVGTCQMAAVTPPLRTSEANKNDMRFKKEWQEKQTAEAINFIKK